MTPSTNSGSFRAAQQLPGQGTTASARLGFYPALPPRGLGLPSYLTAAAPGRGPPARWEPRAAAAPPVTLTRVPSGAGHLPAAGRGQPAAPRDGTGRAGRQRRAASSQRARPRHPRQAAATFGWGCVCSPRPDAPVRGPGPAGSAAPARGRAVAGRAGSRPAGKEAAARRAGKAAPGSRRQQKKSNRERRRGGRSRRPGSAAPAPPPTPSRTRRQLRPPRGAAAAPALARRVCGDGGSGTHTARRPEVPALPPPPAGSSSLTCRSGIAPRPPPAPRARWPPPPPGSPLPAAEERAGQPAERSGPRAQRLPMAPAGRGGGRGPGAGGGAGRSRGGGGTAGPGCGRQMFSPSLPAPHFGLRSLTDSAARPRRCRRQPPRRPAAD